MPIFNLIAEVSHDFEIEADTLEQAIEQAKRDFWEIVEDDTKGDNVSVFEDKCLDCGDQTKCGCQNHCNFTPVQ